MKREIKILAGLLLVFAVLFMRNILSPDVATVKELKYKTSLKGEEKAKTKAGQEEGVDISLLSVKREAFRMGEKNIFEPLSFVVKQKKIRRPEPPKPMPELPPVKEEPTITKVIANYTFLGFMEKGNVKTIFLTRDDETFIVKKGDILSDDYMVKDISDRFINISKTDGSEEISISLIENAPLTGKQ